MGILGFIGKAIKGRTEREASQYTEPVVQRYVKHFGVEKEYAEYNKPTPPAHFTKKERREQRQSFVSQEIGQKASIKEVAHQRVLYTVRPHTAGLSIVAQREIESSARFKQRDAESNARFKQRFYGGG